MAELTPDTKTSFEQYRQSFSEICHQLYEFGLKEEDRRRQEVKALNDVVEDLLSNATKRART